ncbi:MAG: O-antigen ligase family protein [Sedimentisphaerales bacterium]|nr:O-antigen ligase family protein [Sedimentisphaerales bacterium]
MSSHRNSLIDSPHSPEWFDRVIEVLLITLLTFSPLAFGVVHAWSREIFIGLATAITLAFLCKLLLYKNTPFIWSWAFLPVAVIIFIALFQLVSLPTSVVEVLSPNTASLKTELLSDLPDADSVLSTMTLSFYPHATMHNLRLVLAIAAVFIVVINVYRQSEQIKRLLGAIACIGGGIAILALVQVIMGNGKIYWFVPTYDNAHSGPFINHSHFGQFMNLSMGSAIALLLIKLQEVFHKREVTPEKVFEYFGSPSSRTIKLLVLMVILGAASVFVSLTRGGMVSMLIAAAFTVLILSTQRSLQGRGWILVLVALGAFICVLYIGFDAVYDRLSTLRELNEQTGRWQMIKDTAWAWTKFPILGTGLGTHEVVYPMFDRLTIPSLATHAENEYAQAIEEMGIVGLTALGLLGFIVLKKYTVCIRSHQMLSQSIAYGLGFGLIAILIHSLSDFGQHLPANALLTTLFCGLLISLSSSPTVPFSSSELRYETFGHRLGIILLVLLAAVGGWNVLETNAERLAERHWNQVQAIEKSLAVNDWQGNDREYIDLICNAAAAVALESTNAHYLYWLNVYRWRSTERYLNQEQPTMASDQTREIIRKLIEQFHEVKRLCPTFGPAYCVLGQLQQFEQFTLNSDQETVFGTDIGSANIQKGYLLAPGNPTVCLVAGLQDASVAWHQNRVDSDPNAIVIIPDSPILTSAQEKFSRALKLSRQNELFRDIAQVYVEKLCRPDLALDLAQGDARKLAYVGNLMASASLLSKVSISTLNDEKIKSVNATEVIAMAETKTFEQLKEICENDKAPASAHASLARLYEKSGDLEAAVQNYRRAVMLEYDKVTWHYSLARLLADLGRIDEAVEEARVCLRIRPDYNTAKQLIEELSTRMSAVEQ